MYVIICTLTHKPAFSPLLLPALQHIGSGFKTAVILSTMETSSSDKQGSSTMLKQKTNI